jgi:pre-mRNA-splicing factor SYF1
MFENLRLWGLLLDLEESLGTLQSTRDAYSRALEIKAVIVKYVLNFTTSNIWLFGESFGESFSDYERGIELTSFPQASAKLLWKRISRPFWIGSRDKKLSTHAICLPLSGRGVCRVL